MIFRIGYFSDFRAHGLKKPPIGKPLSIPLLLVLLLHQLFQISLLTRLETVEQNQPGSFLSTAAEAVLDPKTRKVGHCTDFGEV